MRAAVLERFGEPAEVLQVRDVALPEPTAGQVRVRMLASPVNPSDLMTVRGRYGRLPRLPATPGFEGMGVIDKVGGGMVALLRRLKPGKRVAVLNQGGGNWQEYVVVSARHVVPIGDLTDAQGATFFVNPATALIMTRTVLRVPRGAWLVQTAAGSALGKMVQRLGQKHGFRVLNIVRREEQAEEMRRAGLVATAAPPEALPAKIRELTGGEEVRHAIDAVGGSTGAAVVTALSLNGRMLVYGTLSFEPMAIDPRTLIGMNASVEGFWLSEWVKRQRVMTLLGLFRDINRLMKEGILTTEVEEFPLDRIADAVRQAETPGRNRKVLLRIGGS